MTPDMPRMAAILFAPDQHVDPVIRAALAGFQSARVLGWLQGREIEGDCDCEDIILTSIQGDTRRRITQNLGREARGCKLDTAALAEVAGWLAAGLEDQPDLVVLNRFGKTEGEGGGLRGILEQVLAENIPVLVPVNRKQLAFWQAFSGGLAQELPCDEAAITTWLRGVLPTA